MSMERSYIEVQTACLGLTQELLAQKVRFMRVGKSALEGADVCLRVYLPNESASEDSDHVPAEFDGFPVKIIKSGRVEKQD